MDMILSDHAEWRCAQRNLSYADVEFVCRYGKQRRNAGVIFCQMWDKYMPKHIPANNTFCRLAGTTVVLCRCGHFVITVYRNGEAFHEDIKKSKYCRHQEASCPYCRQAQAA